jgi:hypothetical protein
MPTAGERARFVHAMLRAVPLLDVVRGAAGRIASIGRPRVLVAPRRSSGTEARDAARALATAPPLFAGPREARALHRLLLPGALASARDRAARILDGEVELFGRTARIGERPDWQLDPLTDLRFDGERGMNEIDLLGLHGAGPDPRGAWELARGAHLVELAAAAALHPALAAPARVRAIATITCFLDDNPPGRGVHWTSPLEAALRAIHWMATLELLRAAGEPVDAAAAERIAGALLEHGRFVAENLEDRALVAGNHLLGDLAGLVAIGARLDGVGEARVWARRAIPRLAAQARRQILDDGADFEASTAYHRFTLELLAAADRFAAAAGRDAGLAPVLARMYGYVAGYLDPRGREPGFGDGDDGRCLPFAPRLPREHGYLLAVGAARLGDATLKLDGAPYSEEAIWLHGAAGWRRYRALPSTAPARSRSFAGGGVHVLRGERAFVAMRAGGYGQRGVGGHAHNDQLAIVVVLDGDPLVIEAGTGCYAADPMWRDRFRGTAAHSTIVVDGREQSEIHAGRPFALPDGAGGRLLLLEDRGRFARLVGEHHGYRRGGAGVDHVREVVVDRDVGAVLAIDRLDGKGSARGELRLHVGERKLRPATAAERARIAERLADAAWAEGADGAPLVLLDDDGVAAHALVRLDGGAPLEVIAGWRSPRYGEVQPSSIVRRVISGRLPLRSSLALLPLRSGRRAHAPALVEAEAMSEAEANGR